MEPASRESELRWAQTNVPMSGWNIYPPEWQQSIKLTKRERMRKENINNCDEAKRYRRIPLLSPDHVHPVWQLLDEKVVEVIIHDQSVGLKVTEWWRNIRIMHSNGVLSHHFPAQG